ncbi:hypothetical protein NG701_17180 [Pseudarthrobacter sp. HLT3-5]|uniref:hypothetical protein n=1 Tax=Pseudarthrobacter cellobiosi TaxID=2953654 RepID=UPI00208F311B|nr:hypothetical protein [Pseudarthrobacter sp. HLT3-5]MCO4276136.1 hypothetical protein [Pseudarthrobacter sp. HLT3-5]
MSILSTFYDTSAGTPASLVTEVKWAKAHPHIGSSEYGVDGQGDFKVTAHPSTPYAVNVAGGKAWGHGVLDESPGVVTVVCDAPAAGVTRWDLITVRRDWTPLAGGPTLVTKVAGGSAKEIPAARENTPGTLDDQPLYLAKWVGGQTQPQDLVDLRVWAGNGGMLAKDDLVRTYLKRIGTEVNINGAIWRLVIGASDTVAWVKASDIGKIPLFGVGNSLVGGAPAAGVQFLVQTGTLVANADNSGYARVTFPNPFPNGVLYANAENGDSSIDQAIGKTISMAMAGAPHWPQPISTNSFVYTVQGDNGTRLPGQLHRANWIAIGW